MIVSLMWDKYGVSASVSIEPYERNEHCSYSGPRSSNEKRVA